jgi:hypothetical protein
MTRGRWVAIAVMAAAIVALAPAAAHAQCAMCRQALDSPEGRRMIAAFQNGIMVLLAAPAGVFGLVALLAVRMQRRRQRAEAGAATASDSAYRSTP